MKRQSKFIISKTPLRVSFFGGGSDLPAYYEAANASGKVISTTIDKYVYVTVKTHGEVFQEHIRLNYSETETAKRREELKNDIIRSCLEYLDIQESLYISSVSDVPAGSGLGSSSSFTVGLLNCLHRFRGDQQLSAVQLAHEAVEVELDYVGSPIGLQDQYGCAVGGFKSIRFFPQRSVQLLSLDHYMEDLNMIFDHCIFLWTGDTRSANSILSDQVRNSSKNESSIARLVELAFTVEENIASQMSPGRFGSLLHESWLLKRELSQGISYSKIDMAYDQAMRLGAYGGKLLGAGGGGFLMLVAPQKLHCEISAALRGLIDLPVAPVVCGTEIIYSDT